MQYNQSASRSGAAGGSSDTTLDTAQVAVPVEMLYALLRNAAKSGNLGIIKHLFTDGVVDTATIDAPDSRMRTALHHACANGHLGVAACLIGKGANPNATALAGFGSPLFIAKLKKHALIEQLLLKHHAQEIEGSDEPYVPPALTNNADDDVVDIDDDAVAIQPDGYEATNEELMVFNRKAEGGFRTDAELQAAVSALPVADQLKLRELIAEKERERVHQDLRDLGIEPDDDDAPPGDMANSAWGAC